MPTRSVLSCSHYIATQALLAVLQQTEDEIGTRGFVRQHLSRYSVVSVGKVLTESLSQMEDNPMAISLAQEEQAGHLPMDNFMSVENVEEQSEGKTKKKLLTKLSVESKIGGKIISHSGENKSQQSTKKKQGQLISMVSSEVERENHYVAILRVKKNEEQEEQRREEEKMKQKKPVRVVTDRNINFDYEGQLFKCMDTKRTNLVSSTLNGEIYKELMRTSEKLAQCIRENVGGIRKIEEERLSKEAKRAVKKGDEEAKNVYINEDSRDGMVKAIEMKQNGIKLTIGQSMLERKEETATLDGVACKLKSKNKLSKLEYEMIRAVRAVQVPRRIFTDYTEQLPILLSQKPRKISTYARATTEVSKSKNSRSVIKVINQVESSNLIRLATQDSSRLSFPLSRYLAKSETKMIARNPEKGEAVERQKGRVGGKRCKFPGLIGC